MISQSFFIHLQVSYFLIISIWIRDRAYIDARWWARICMLGNSDWACEWKQKTRWYSRGASTWYRWQVRQVLIDVDKAFDYRTANRFIAPYHVMDVAIVTEPTIHDCKNNYRWLSLNAINRIDLGAIVTAAAATMVFPWSRLRTEPVRFYFVLNSFQCAHHDWRFRDKFAILTLLL